MPKVSVRPGHPTGQYRRGGYVFGLEPIVVKRSAMEKDDGALAKLLEEDEWVVIDGKNYAQRHSATGLEEPSDTNAAGDDQDEEDDDGIVAPTVTTGGEAPTPPPPPPAPTGDGKGQGKTPAEPPLGAGNARTSSDPQGAPKP